MSASRQGPAPLGALFGVLLAAVLSSAIGSAPLQDWPQPTFRADANYVRVDVYPTANGAPVVDLRQDDFEVLEDNAPQKIEAFEQVTIRGGLPQELRAEPNTVAQSRAMLENPRARVFVIFLDTNHVDADGSHNIGPPLVNALNRMIGPDDLVGVMTPDMAASDVTFGRRTTTIEGMLTRHWDWGQRGRVSTSADSRERAYQLCYPGFSGQCGDDRGIADAMIARRREKLTLDAIDDLIAYLEGAREERKALIVISDGWLLYRRDDSLSRRVNTCQSPGQSVGIDPRTGRLTTNQPVPGGDVNLTQCEADRVSLAQIDDRLQFETMLNVANRANVSFYPIDPRGLPVFDTPIDFQRTGAAPAGQPILPPPSVDNAMLRARQSALRDLASATDGLAIMNTNDLDAGLRRVTEDLSSYYLLGYYSTGKPDGKFHAIRVRVKRAGVQVRARRGYLAPTAADIARFAAPRPGSPSPAPAASAAVAGAVATALSALSGIARDTSVRMSIVGGWKPDNTAVVWAVGELGAGIEWRRGATVDVILTDSSGGTVATVRQPVAAGSRSFRVALGPDGPSARDYTARVRVSPSSGDPPVTDVTPLALPALGASSGALVVRRGPATANQDAPTVDLRFRRTEQIRVELLDPSAQAPTARLLDRAGKPMPIPVTTAVRTDPDGSRWTTGQLALTPLAPGDYLIELVRGVGTIAADGAVRAGAADGGGRAGGSGQAATPGIESTVTLVAFRVIP